MTDTAARTASATSYQCDADMAGNCTHNNPPVDQPAAGRHDGPTGSARSTCCMSSPQKAPVMTEHDGVDQPGQRTQPTALTAERTGAKVMIPHGGDGDHRRGKGAQPRHRAHGGAR